MKQILTFFKRKRTKEQVATGRLWWEGNPFLMGKQPIKIRPHASSRKMQVMEGNDKKEKHNKQTNSNQ